MKLKHLTVNRLLALAAKGDISKLIVQLAAYPAPDRLRVWLRRLPYPKSLEEATASITFAQKEFLSAKPDNDLDLLIRMFDGFFSPKPFSPERALRFGKKAGKCNAAEFVSVCALLAELISELNAREDELLYVEPDKTWMAAGGGRLSHFSPLLTREYLASKIGCSIDEVDNQPYSICLAWLTIRAEQNRVEKEFNRLQAEKIKHESRANSKRG